MSRKIAFLVATTALLALVSGPALAERDEDEPLSPSVIDEQIADDSEAPLPDLAEPPPGDDPATTRDGNDAPTLSAAEVQTLELSSMRDLPPGQTAIETWRDENPWHYSTDWIFPLTRGLDEVGAQGWVEWLAYVVTVPIDLAQLPLGAIAGLFGD